MKLNKMPVVSFDNNSKLQKTKISLDKNSAYYLKFKMPPVINHSNLKIRRSR